MPSSKKWKSTSNRSLQCDYREYGYGNSSDDETDTNNLNNDNDNDYFYVRSRPVNQSSHLERALGLRRPSQVTINISSIIPISSKHISFVENETDESIGGFLNDPIRIGYLLEYCKSKYNAETMIFVLEIYKFKDICSDRTAWSDEISYQDFDSSFEYFHLTRLQEADLIFGSQSSETKWPSKLIQLCSFQEHVEMIWDTYLSSSSPTQVCISSTVLSNTIHRLKYLHVYGNQVFDETLIDPIRTINRDILPKFLMSDHYILMKNRIESLNLLPPKSTFEMRLPSYSDVLNWDNEDLTIENLRDISLASVFHDRFLYEKFLKYAETMYAEENVYLLRAITIFRSHFSHVDPYKVAAGIVPFEIEEQAWFIYRYFIAPGSAYEMSGLSHTQVKSIMSDLAHPHLDMFLEVEEDVYRFTHNIYQDFSYTEEFFAIPSIIKSMIACENNETMEKEKMRKQRDERKAELIATSSCFGKTTIKDNNTKKLRISSRKLSFSSHSYATNDVSQSIKGKSSKIHSPNIRSTY